MGEWQITSCPLDQVGAPPHTMTERAAASAPPAQPKHEPRVRRPNLFMRIAAGIAVVLAALVPIAALVFFMLHIFNGLTFTQLT